jgi:hypothetical protein
MDSRSSGDDYLFVFFLGLDTSNFSYNFLGGTG